MMRTRRKHRDTQTPELPNFLPHVEFHPTVIPGKDGSFLVIPGKPTVTHEEAEIGTAEFARRTGLSQEHVSRLCDTGDIKCRRKTPRKKSAYLIPVSEVTRFKTADPHEV